MGANGFCKVSVCPKRRCKDGLLPNRPTECFSAQLVCRVQQSHPQKQHNSTTAMGKLGDVLAHPDEWPALVRRPVDRSGDTDLLNHEW